MTGGTREVEVVRSGWLTTVQDGGRRGLAHLAIPASGALDRPAWRLANQLVGNPEGVAGLETTLTGVAVRAGTSCAVAVTGAPAPVSVDGRPARWGAPVELGPGQVLDVGTATDGLRSYVAVSGGIAVSPVFGSRATDLLSGLGPPALTDGSVIPLGDDPGPPPPQGQAPLPPPSLSLTLRLYPGPRQDWLTEVGLGALVNQSWAVASASNRIGIRLDGPSLERARTEELPSEGVVLGAVQLLPDGRPLVFLADHPTTGGYPVVGVVDEGDLPACAQARPGTPVRFQLRPAPWAAFQPAAHG
ncbi:MAG: biotin-dependent carboxyltransferase family protein [Acidimicrobiales bacterium]